MEESYSARPLVGRWLALDLRPTRPLTFLGPSWAVICGAVASGGLTLRAQTVILLGDVLLGAGRSLWLQSDWRDALRRAAANTPTWFLASDEASRWRIVRVWRQSARRVRFFRTVIWPVIDADMVGMLMLGVLALSVASVLGLLPVVLTLVAMVIALIEGQIDVSHRIWLKTLLEFALPWLIAQSAFGSFSALSLFFTLVFTLVYRGLLGLSAAREDRWIVWNNLAQLVAALVLFASNAPAVAGLIALGLLAQVLWQSRYRVNRDGRAYVQRVQSYVLVAMLATSLALWF